MAGTLTKVTVRVIAVGGKFLGDDIGGAEVSIRDVRTGKLMASGRTRGGSGPAALMTTPLTRSQPIPTQDGPANSACRFDAELNLEAPRLIEICAFGPLAAQQSANRVSATTWIYPGKNLSPGQKTDREDGFLLAIPGLLVQVLEPPAHYLPYHPDPLQAIPIRANVTMMCGCPIAPSPWHGAASDWPVTDFEVAARIVNMNDGTTVDVHLQFDPNAPGGAPSQFSYGGWVPKIYGVFEITVSAYQKSTGNTGIDRTTVNLQAPASV
jgi:hypothetical protein